MASWKPIRTNAFRTWIFTTTAISVTTAFAISNSNSLNKNVPIQTNYLPERTNQLNLVNKPTLPNIHQYATHDSKLASSSTNVKAVEQTIVPTGPASSYYLLLSPKALLQIGGVTTLLLLPHAFFPAARRLLTRLNYLTLPKMAASCHSSMTNLPSQEITRLTTQVSLPLLSSACCLVQLFLNVFSVGCAGLNTYLGPLRAYFMGILSYFTIVSFPHVKWLNLGISWGLAWLPEFLYFYTTRKPFKSITAARTAATWHENRGLGEKGLDGNSTTKKKLVVQMYVPTMGCVACINKIQNTLNTCLTQTLESSNVSNEDASFLVDSWLLDPSKKQPESSIKLDPVMHKKGGMARVVLEYSGEKLDEESLTVDYFTQAIEKAGFKDCEILSWTTADE